MLTSTVEALVSIRIKLLFYILFLIPYLVAYGYSLLTSWSFWQYNLVEDTIFMFMWYFEGGVILMWISLVFVVGALTGLLYLIYLIFTRLIVSFKIKVALCFSVLVLALLLTFCFFVLACGLPMITSRTRVVSLLVFWYLGSYLIANFLILSAVLYLFNFEYNTAAMVKQFISLLCFLAAFGIISFFGYHLFYDTTGYVIKAVNYGFIAEAIKQFLIKSFELNYMLKLSRLLKNPCLFILIDSVLFYTVFFLAFFCTYLILVQKYDRSLNKTLSAAIILLLIILASEFYFFQKYYGVICLLDQAHVFKPLLCTYIIIIVINLAIFFSGALKYRFKVADCDVYFFLCCCLFFTIIFIMFVIAL